MTIAHMSKTVFKQFVVHLTHADGFTNNITDVCVHHKNEPIGMFISMKRYDQLRELELKTIENNEVSTM